MLRWCGVAIRCGAGGDEHVMQARQSVDIAEAECWKLLSSVSVGRVIFTQHALPAVRLVNHLIEDSTIVIRSHLGSAITAHAAQDGAIVCYEADELDPARRTGWSVTATGPAFLVADPAAATRYQRLLEPWADGQMDYVISIRPQLVTGIRLVG